ncbi:hypothetical protein SAMN04487830_10610 [Pseudobutyrivibrio sp. OR37]|uniref:hypothetical protein n=1 Tax=Pseudobutyrivibrio sp. OR37 TaxID=1798186 RepID=UPI0008F029FB|nr:hypothetical protein [Pseudobutyrivibrio sp. OR37]SFH70838.1 hypothetical protein SAMN04487830_10610 [Pseudobutyrivibrio sp. OR37]
MKNNNKETVKTTFNCPIDLRDRLETLINDNIGQYTPDEIMEILLTKALVLVECDNISFDSAIKANNKYEEIHYVLLDIRGPQNSFSVEQLFDDKLIHNKYDICGILAKTEYDATGNKAQLNKSDKEAIKEIINQLNKC